MRNLVPPKNPNAPVAPTQYDARYQDQLNSVHRLYFNQIDNVNSALLGDAGGRNLEFPFISALYYPDQLADSPYNNTPTKVKWSTASGNIGFTLNVDNTATAQYAGWYKITYSLQFANGNNTVHDAIVWLRVNGTDVADSTTIFTVPARKSAGVYSYTCGYSEVVFYMEAGDSVGLWWGTDVGAPTVGGSGVWIYARAAQTSPMAYPETPSAIGSITFVSSKLA